ncbi:MAG: CBS domain-containing protein [Candidatus Glassbacteria bacterium]|nr:CBS domain-containing protein [Candidatus Glassbacteria bacterium]
MSTVGDLLKTKGSQVLTTYEDNLIADTVAVLVEHNIGSLIVMDHEHHIVGIITERDIMRVSHRKGPDFGKTKVGEVMTPRDDLVVGLLEDTVDYIMQVMTQNKIRHVPIIDKERLLGMLSIGDVVKARLDAVQTENHYLRDYLGDKYPA